MNLNEFLSQCSLPSGSSRRYDCPACGGSKSLSVTNKFGVLVYNCYRSVCKVSGAKGTQVTLSDVERALTEVQSEPREIKLPSYFLPLDLSRCKGYYTLRPCMAAIQQGLLQVFLDVKEQRLVFPVWKAGKLVDATGRTLVKGTKPKWKRYSDSRYPFICGSGGGTLVIVEDCISAAAVAGTGLYTGCAIMGTSIHSGYTVWLKQFQRVIVALDYDAACKSIEGAKSLSWLLPTHPVIIKKDLKEYSTEEIKEILENVRL